MDYRDTIPHIYFMQSPQDRVLQGNKSDLLFHPPVHCGSDSPIMSSTAPWIILKSCNLSLNWTRHFCFGAVFGCSLFLSKLLFLGPFSDFYAWKDTPTYPRIGRLAIFLIVKYVEFRTRNMPFQFWKKQISSPCRQRSSAYVSVAYVIYNVWWFIALHLHLLHVHMTTEFFFFFLLGR
jgi:hypothetical protein